MKELKEAIEKAKKRILTASNTGMNPKLLEIEIGHTVDYLLSLVAENSFEAGFDLGDFIPYSRGLKDYLKQFTDQLKEQI